MKILGKLSHTCKGPNRTINITLNANTKEIITLHTLYGHIVRKS